MMESNVLVDVSLTFHACLFTDTKLTSQEFASIKFLHFGSIYQKYVETKQLSSSHTEVAYKMWRKEILSSSINVKYFIGINLSLNDAQNGLNENRCVLEFWTFRPVVNQVIQLDFVDMDVQWELEVLNEQSSVKPGLVNFNWNDILLLSLVNLQTYFYLEYL